MDITILLSIAEAAASLNCFESMIDFVGKLVAEVLVLSHHPYPKLHPSRSGNIPLHPLLDSTRGSSTHWMAFLWLTSLIVINGNFFRSALT